MGEAVTEGEGDQKRRRMAAGAGGMRWCNMLEAMGMRARAEP